MSGRDILTLLGVLAVAELLAGVIIRTGQRR
jgi:hypothetical protein